MRITTERTGNERKKTREDYLLTAQEERYIELLVSDIDELKRALRRFVDHEISGRDSTTIFTKNSQQIKNASRQNAFVDLATINGYKVIFR